MPLCFAIMPITTPDDVLLRYDSDKEHFVHVAEYIFRPAAEAAGYNFVPPSVAHSKVIQAEIIRNLEEADLVICDISTWNANVFFELGIRVALNRPVAMVRDNLTTTIPFDNTPISIQTYNASMAPWSLEEEIPKLKELIESVGKQEQNELWRHFGITQRAKQSDPTNPEDAKLTLILEALSRLDPRPAPAEYEPQPRRTAVASRRREPTQDVPLLATRRDDKFNTSRETLKREIRQYGKDNKLDLIVHSFLAVGGVAIMAGKRLGEAHMEKIGQMVATLQDNPTIELDEPSEKRIYKFADGKIQMILGSDAAELVS